MDRSQVDKQSNPPAGDRRRATSQVPRPRSVQDPATNLRALIQENRRRIENELSGTIQGGPTDSGSTRIQPDTQYQLDRNPGEQPQIRGRPTDFSSTRMQPDTHYQLDRNPSQQPQIRGTRPQNVQQSSAYGQNQDNRREYQEQVGTDQSGLGASAQVQQEQSIAGQGSSSRLRFSALSAETVAKMREVDELFLGIRDHGSIPTRAATQASYAEPEGLKQSRETHESYPENQRARPQSGGQVFGQRELMGQMVTKNIPGRNRSLSTPTMKPEHLFGRAEDALRHITRISPASKSTYGPKENLENSNIDPDLLRGSAISFRVQQLAEVTRAARPAANRAQGQETAQIHPPPIIHARNSPAPKVRQDTSSRTETRVTGQQIPQRVAPNINFTRSLRPSTMTEENIVFSPGVSELDSSVSYSTSLLPLPDIEVQEGLLALDGPEGKKGCLTFLISGSVCSGKTTLAYLLATIFEGVSGSVETAKGKGTAKADAITKVIIIHQEEYHRLIHKEIPRVQWSEPHPYLFPWELATKPNDLGRDAPASGREASRENEKYWEAAYNANVGINPRSMWKESAKPHSRHHLPDPISITKETIFVNSREACDWNRLGLAVYNGMQQNAGELGTLETEDGRKHTEAAVKHVVNADLLEKLRERVRAWIKEETAKNTQHGFPGRALRNGAMREILILEGPSLFLLSRNRWNRNVFSKGGEKLMEACDVKLFLPTSKMQAAKRRFSKAEFIDPPIGTKLPSETWKEKGYFERILWSEYAEEHKWLFADSEVDGARIKPSKECEKYGVQIRPFHCSPEVKIWEKQYNVPTSWADETLAWAVETILKQLSSNETFGRQRHAENVAMEDFFDFTAYEES